jgi:hypothetical protein
MFGILRRRNINELFWQQEADIFIRQHRDSHTRSIDSLADRGLKVIAAMIAECSLAVFRCYSDFINNGMARVFALMSNPEKTDAEGIFEDVAATIHRAMDGIHAINPSKKDLTASGYEIALKQLL